MAKYQVKITAVSDRAWFALGKALRTVAGLSWLESRRLRRYLLKVDDSTEELVHLPCVLVAGIDGATADHAAGLLRKAGAIVSVEEATVQQPMLLCPKANQRYQWDAMLGARPIMDQPPSRKRSVARRIAWTALFWAWLSGVLSGFVVEAAPAGGPKLVWAISWLPYGAVVGAAYGALWGLLKGIGRLSDRAAFLLVASWFMALMAQHSSSKLYADFSSNSVLGRTLLGAIYGAILVAVVWLMGWLLRLLWVGFVRLFRLPPASSQGGSGA
jgi:hypothetical protein